MTSETGDRAPRSVGVRDLHPALRVRLLVAFVERGLNAVVVPLTAIYLSAQIGAGPAGLLILVSVMVAVLAGLASGHVADVLGRRRALLAGAVLMTVGFLGMALAAGPLGSPMTLFACYLLQVAAASFIQPVHDAVIIDVTVPEERPFVYTVNYWSFNIALGLGALLAGFLYGRHFVGLLLAGAACLVAAGVLTYRYLPETAPDAPAPEVTGKSGARRALAGYLLPLRDRRFVMLLAAFTLVLGLEMQRTSGYIAVHIASDVPRQHVLPLLSWLPKLTGVEVLGVVQALNTAAVAVLALVMKYFLRGRSDRFRVTLGVVLFTGACGALAVSTVTWVLLVAVLVLTLGELLHIPVMQTVLAGAVPEGARTRYMAVFNLNVRGGMVIAALSLSAGAVISSWGMAVVYGLIGACACRLYWSLLTAERNARREPDPVTETDGMWDSSRESEGALS